MMSPNIEQINNILNDLWNFHLVLFGIALSLFTLLYSFILSKRDELRNISEQVKMGNNSPILTQKEVFAKKYITRLKSANNHSAIIIIVTFFLFVISWISLRIISNTCIYPKKIMMFSISILTFFVVLYVLFIFIKVYKHYKQETKI